LGPKKSQSKNRRAMISEFSGLEEAIRTLKKAEKELDDLKSSEHIFGPQMESIRKNLKSPNMARQVEQDLRKLKDLIRQHGETAKPQEVSQEPSSGCADVFISYAEEDGDTALEIALSLEQAGYATWCYDVNSTPGVSYLLQTGQAIDGAQAFLILISPQSITSRQVTQEVIRAHESSKKFVPVLRGISHMEFQDRQPEWRAAIGAATSVRLQPEGVPSIIPRIVAGLKAAGIAPRPNIEPGRVEGVRKSLVLLQDKNNDRSPRQGNRQK
jgi:hypothetical protein